MRILHALGMEAFVAWADRPHGLRTSAVAEALDVSPQLVNDRVARLTAAGVITGHRLLPNLRHCGTGMTVYHLQGATVPAADQMERLADVDGLARIVWFLDSGLCINVSHANPAQAARRAEVIRRLAPSDGAPSVLYELSMPEVRRTLGELDWRIIRCLVDDAKRPLADVAAEVGVSTRTVRTRLQRMRDEGSIDEFLKLDLSKLQGIIPFQLNTWHEPDASPERALLDHFHDRHLVHFRPPAENGYCSFIMRTFAYTPAEVQTLVREASAIEGVARAEPMLVTGGWENPQWLAELIAAQAPPVLPG